MFGMTRSLSKPLVAVAILAVTVSVFMMGGSSVSAATDYDTDNDNLIEISNPAQLDALRYDTNGDGTPDTGGVRKVDQNQRGWARGPQCRKQRHRT